MSEPGKCPHCGVEEDDRSIAERTRADLEKIHYWVCGSLLTDLGWSIRTVKCYERQIASLKAENETLRAAIATPEVYAGVVSEIVEKDAAARIAALKAERDQLRDQVATLQHQRSELHEKILSMEKEQQETMTWDSRDENT